MLSLSSFILIIPGPGLTLVELSQSGQLMLCTPSASIGCRVFCKLRLHDSNLDPETGS